MLKCQDSVEVWPPVAPGWEGEQSVLQRIRNTFNFDDSEKAYLFTHDGFQVKATVPRFRTHIIREDEDRPYGKISPERLKYIFLIKNTLLLKYRSSECWDVGEDHSRPWNNKRLYVCWPCSFLVWLEPDTSHENGWFLSSAYRKNNKLIRPYVAHGKGKKIAP